MYYVEDLYSDICEWSCKHHNIVDIVGLVFYAVAMITSILLEQFALLAFVAFGFISITTKSFEQLYLQRHLDVFAKKQYSKLNHRKFWYGVTCAVIGVYVVGTFVLLQSAGMSVFYSVCLLTLGAAILYNCFILLSQWVRVYSGITHEKELPTNILSSMLMDMAVSCIFVIMSNHLMSVVDWTCCLLVCVVPGVVHLTYFVITFAQCFHRKVGSVSVHEHDKARLKQKMLKK